MSAADNTVPDAGAYFEIAQRANGLVWKEPPPQRSYRERKDLATIVAELHANPGRWALIYENASAGCCRTLKRRGLQVRTVRVSVEGATHDIYARWPEEVPHAQ